MSSSTLETTSPPPGAAPDALPDGPGPTGPPGRGGLWHYLRPVLLRLHFYAGILVGPFLLLAALTGLLYAFSPTLEDAVHRDVLFVADVAAEPLPVADQVRAARAAYPDGVVEKVVLPGEDDRTTRVLIAADDVAEGMSRTVFVDPYTAEVSGALETSGDKLPFRSWLADLHTSLHLGDPGRIYSETAASWLWVMVLGGLAMWIAQVARRRKLRALVVPDVAAARGRRRTMSWHGSVGTLAALGLLGLSATGLTWSVYAGANVDALRAALAWETPAVDTTLTGPADGGAGAHEEGHGGAGEAAAGHAGHGDHAASSDTAADTELFGGPQIGVGVTGVLAAARAEGLRDPLEIVPAAEPGEAWTVMEVRRSFPTQRDAIAVDPMRGLAVDRVDFADHPIASKLSRWGIDLHMGLMFGIWNQLLLAGVAAGLITLVVIGYRMWWQRRPRGADRFAFGRPMPRGGLRRAPLWLAVGLLAVAAGIGWFLPLFGISLAAFLVVDLLAGVLARRSAARRATAGA
ncbi:PepSY domain-containing protein [Myceligenerans crystallogenes]|uniref:PepSY-associated TM helix domain-containing protein n=1 Tax=Myceligenerans crystallogenes TaxID=316335 RepID=A0ABN2N647_9MICO